MRKFASTTLATLALALAANGTYAAGIATTASVFLRAEPGSYVGYGLPTAGVTWIHGIDTTFRTVNTGDKAAYIYTNSWTFKFAAARYSAVDNLVTNRPLQLGFYDNATRYPFNSLLRPGMDVSGDSRGYNQLSGWFNVLEVQYDASFEITSLAVDFAEYGENLTQSGPALYGSLRYNSSVPLTTTVPEPSALLQLSAGILGLLALMKKKRLPNQI